ncbi:MAG: 23S rRNA (guanosine(2251)-2'-O)-methyltransferase RlmB [Bacteroidales bacterium]|jgi:23S rRNA (guanosine2251-2'-O)-methyltransferase|nr:23S rRNA (guanosine(2251)-2'-O)-methyltransferase RlmB [Bacteroidales bacterium]
MKENSDYIYGLRPVLEAIASGKNIDRLILRKGLKGSLYFELMQAVRDHSIPYQLVPVEKLNRISRKNHQGVIALISEIEYHDIYSMLPGIYESGREPFLLILNNITDVGNFGAIARSAECFGVDCIIIPEKGSARINAEAVKASAGALNKIPVARIKSIMRTLDFLKDSGLKIICATEMGSSDPGSADLSGPSVLVMGSEDRGVSPEILKASDMLVSIPMTGSIGSLNVSVAAGILLYEMSSRRTRNNNKTDK